VRIRGLSAETKANPRTRTYCRFGWAKTSTQAVRLVAGAGRARGAGARP
jgi:hypothetical protein